MVQDADLLVASEIDEIQQGKELNVLLNLATCIEEEWLEELFPEAVKWHREIFYDRAAKRVMAEDQKRYHDLVLQSKKAEPSADQAARLLADEVLAGNLSLNKWDDAVEQWILRVNWLAGCCPDFALPGIGDAERRLMIEQLCLGAVSYKDIRDRAVWPAVKGLLADAQLRLIEQHAPERIEIGGRRPFRLVYSANAAPQFAARIQDLFGVRRIPAIAAGRVQPAIQILAPNQRPVQVTQDLAGFWTEHYPRIRQELKRKYPKHAWPEDPG